MIKKIENNIELQFDIYEAHTKYMFKCHLYSLDGTVSNTQMHTNVTFKWFTVMLIYVLDKSNTWLSDMLEFYDD